MTLESNKSVRQIGPYYYLLRPCLFDFGDLLAAADMGHHMGARTAGQLQRKIPHATGCARH
jgi:hypothetical protein